jgi:hypothetical protein
MSMALPKAGAIISGIPITVAEILFASSLLCVCVKYNYRFRQNTAIYKLKNIIYLMILSMSLVLLINIIEGELQQILPTIVIMFSPLAVFIGSTMNYDKGVKIVAVSLLITGAFALLQWEYGIFNSSIQGITIAFGESYYAKPLGFWKSDFFFAEAAKMPSTYQNGNLVASFYVFAISTLLTYQKQNSNTPLVYSFIIFIGIAGLLLSGARSLIYPFMVFAIFIFNSYFKSLNSKKKRKLILLIFFILPVGIFIFISFWSDSTFVNYFIARNILSTIQDTTMSGRTIEYLRLLSYIQNINVSKLLRLFILGAPHGALLKTEGLTYVFARYGIIAFLLFNIIILYPISKISRFNKPVALSMIMIYISFLVDNSYQFPPTLMNYFLLCGLHLNQDLYAESLSSRRLEMRGMTLGGQVNSEQIK